MFSLTLLVLVHGGEMLGYGGAWPQIQAAVAMHRTGLLGTRRRSGGSGACSWRPRSYLGRGIGDRRHECEGQLKGAGE